MARSRALRLAAWMTAAATIGPGGPGAVQAAETATGGEVTCWRIATVPGPEDLVVDRSGHRPRLLVSSQTRRGNPRPKGAIYGVGLGDDGSEAQPLRLEGRDDCSFHPHGISLVRRGNVAPLLYVINHHEAEDTSPSRGCLPGAERLARHGATFTSVEVFKVEPNRLRFLQRLANPEVLLNGNDLVALEDGRFFVTSPPAGLLGAVFDSLDDQGAAPPGSGGLHSGPVSSMLDRLVTLPGAAWRRVKAGLTERGTSEIVEFRCLERRQERCVGTFRSIAKVGNYINGIEARPLENGRHVLYAASTRESGLYVIEEAAIGAESESGWMPARRFEAVSGLDNLTWESDDRRTLLGVAHPDLKRFLQHTRSPEVSSPSEVWAISTAAPPETELRVSLSGSLISAASTATCVGHDLVIGQVFQSAVLRCSGSDNLCTAEMKEAP